MLLVYHSLGVILLPVGDLSFIHHLPEMYEHCRQEDPDMNLPDFMLEHCLNLEDIIADFEQKEEPEEDEKPHQPYAQTQVHTQFVVTPARIAVWVSNGHLIPDLTAEIFPLQNDCYLPSACVPGIFRPPIGASVALQQLS